MPFNLFRRTKYFGYRLQNAENRVAELERHLAATVPPHASVGRFTEPKSAPLGSWQRLDSFNSYSRSRALLSAGDLYVGFDAGRVGEGALKRYSGEWRDVFSRPGITEIVTICEHAGEIWFGATSRADGASVWRGDGEQFELAGQWPDYFSVASIKSFDNRLHCSLVPNAKDEQGAPVLNFAGNKWNAVLSGHPYQCVYDLHEHAGRLYGATMAHGWLGGHVIDALTGEVIGGDGRRGSWSHMSTMLRLCSFGKYLIAVGNREPAAPGPHSNLWCYDGEQWSPLPALPEPYARLYSFNAVRPFGGTLLIGCGSRPAGHATILALANGGLEPIGGAGLNGSWSPHIHRRMNAPMVRGSQADYVYQFCEHDGALITGFGASPGCGQVWQFRPSGWRAERCESRYHVRIRR